MAYKPVGVDEYSRFPLRVRQALAETFVTKPQGIEHGQVPTWDAETQTWVPGDSGASDISHIDGGAP